MDTSDPPPGPANLLEDALRSPDGPPLLVDPSSPHHQPARTSANNNDDADDMVTAAAIASDSSQSTTGGRTARYAALGDQGGSLPPRPGRAKLPSALSTTRRQKATTTVTTIRADGAKETTETCVPRRRLPTLGPTLGTHTSQTHAASPTLALPRSTPSTLPRQVRSPCAPSPPKARPSTDPPRALAPDAL